MSTTRNAIQGLLFCQVVSLAFLFASCSKEEVPSLRIGTGGVEGTYLIAGRALARVVNANLAMTGFNSKAK